MRRRRQNPWLALAALLAVVGLAVLTRTATGEPGPPPSAVTQDQDRSGPAEDRDGLPTVRLGDLPPEAAETLDLVRAGGPFPHDRDDTVFRNREGLLPDQPRGWYREYTVPTPGEDDRGARRLVRGRDGTTYWTDDHYASFTRVVDA